MSFDDELRTMTRDCVEWLGADGTITVRVKDLGALNTTTGVRATTTTSDADITAIKGEQAKATVGGRGGRREQLTRTYEVAVADLTNTASILDSAVASEKSNIEVVDGSTTRRVVDLEYSANGTSVRLHTVDDK